jgi:two-component system response regulator MprA
MPDAQAVEADGALEHGDPGEQEDLDECEVGTQEAGDPGDADEDVTGAPRRHVPAVNPEGDDDRRVRGDDEPDGGERDRPPAREREGLRPRLEMVEGSDRRPMETRLSEGRLRGLLAPTYQRRQTLVTMLVLVADDDRAVREALERALQLNGFDVALAADGNEALSETADRTPDALVLDVMMPGYDGLDVTRRLRREGNRVPILLLTARDAVGDRVEGLDAGADDYLPKPFALEELLARLRALLRRADAAPAELLRFADLTYDVGSMEARRGGRRFELTTTEAHLLELFMRNPRQVLPRPLIYERVWGYDFSHTSNALDVYVGYLRRKTEAGGEPRLIHTVRGTGYVLREP